MKYILRILYAIYLIIGASFSIYVMIASKSDIIKAFQSNYTYIIASCIILLILSLVLLFAGSFKKEEKSISIETQFGLVAFTLTTLENLARSALTDIKGIKEYKVLTHIKKQKVNYQINVVVSKDTVIPDLSAVIQKNIIDFVEHATALKVGTVKVRINNVHTYLTPNM